MTIYATKEDWDLFVKNYPICMEAFSSGTSPEIKHILRIPCRASLPQDDLGNAQYGLVAVDSNGCFYNAPPEYFI